MFEVMNNIYCCWHLFQHRPEFLGVYNAHLLYELVFTLPFHLQSWCFSMAPYRTPTSEFALDLTFKYCKVVYE